MRYLLCCLLVVVLVGSLFAQRNDEFRATWVITKEWTSTSGTVEDRKDKIRIILDNHKKANMNAVLWQVRQSGTAYYPSSFEPWGYYLDHQSPGFDPVEFTIEEAHKRGMEFHAWFNVFLTSSTQAGTPAAEHPEWICRDQAGIPMTSSRAVSPGLEAVRTYTINVAMEIVNNYDIDGLHLDYVRWNEYSNSSQSLQFAKMAESSRLLDGMITNAQIEDLQTNASGRYLYDIEHPFSGGVPSGFVSWEDWWRWSVTEFVHTLHDSIQVVKPWVRLSPAALGKYNWSGWQGYGVVYQDAALWFNEGYIDQLTPMHYHWLTASEFYDVIAGGSIQSWGAWIQKGITDGRLFTVGPGSYRFAESNVWGRHPSIVDTVRSVLWVDGFQFFSYGSWEDYKYWQEAGDTFFKNKTKVRGSRLIVGDPPDAPTINLIKIDPLNYQIEVNPPASINTAHRFAIYRSPDADLDLNNDEIIDIHFGDSSYSYVDQFSGLQDFNGEYYYFASTLDRFWNESEISNFMKTDSIPSFAPMVLNITPMNGDTIAVNEPFKIDFSKTMNINSFLNAFSMRPEIQINQFIWSNENKSVAISFAGNLEPGAEYFIVLNSSLIDVNGVSLDGNGDGIPGDSLVIKFFTKPVDVAGPKVLLSNPDITSKNENFNVGGVLSVLFDELINKVTINDTTVVLYQGGNQFPIKYNLFDVDFKSVLSVQSANDLLMNTEYTLFLSPFISDTSGNPIGNEISISFKTENKHYYKKELIDDFITVGNWWQPEGSGSTTGIYVPNTTFSSTRNSVFLPASKTPIERYVARLTYQWDLNESSHLLREYLSGGSPRSVEFDTSYTLQCYIFGDGSNNKFRFAIDEAVGPEWPNHEVSTWVTIDWIGWKLIEWNLSDPNSVGSWIGNNVLDGSKYRIDSFQMTYEPGAAISGQIYFDNLRLVKKSSAPVSVAEDGNNLPAAHQLGQNYPNPFNPKTTIPFVLKKQQFVKLKIFDISGREVATLVDKTLPAGRHSVIFDASNYASGIYYYRMVFNGQVLTKSMLYVK